MRDDRPRRVLPPVDTTGWRAEEMGTHAEEVRQMFVTALADWPLESFTDDSTDEDQEMADE